MRKIYSTPKTNASQKIHQRKAKNTKKNSPKKQAKTKPKTSKKQAKNKQTARNTSTNQQTHKKKIKYINSIINDTHILTMPLFFALMPNKRAESYNAFFEYIQSYLTHLNPEKQAIIKEYGISDQEAALHNALEAYLCKYA